MTVDAFSSRAFLVDSLAASAAIPLFTAAPLWVPWAGGSAVDGGVVCNTPLFTDARRDQLVVNLGFLDYPHEYTFSPSDPAHEVLVAQGQDDAAALLRGSALRRGAARPRTHATRRASSVLQVIARAAPLAARDQTWFAFFSFGEARRRLLLDAEPWLRVVCVEGGAALRVYRWLGVEAICTAPTDDVLRAWVAAIVLALALGCARPYAPLEFR